MKLCLISLIIVFVLVIVIRVMLRMMSDEEQMNVVLNKRLPTRIVVLTLIWLVSCITAVIGAVIWIIQA